MRKSRQILLNWPSGESPWRAAGPQLRSLSRSLSEHHRWGNAHRPRNAPGWESHDCGRYLVLVLLLHPHPTHDSNHPPPVSHSYPVMLWNSPASISVSWDHFQNAHGDFTSSVEGMRLRRGWGEDMETLPYMPEFTDHEVLSHGTF